MVKKSPVPATKEDIDKVINASINDEYFYTLFMVAKTTGRRLGELYSVKVKDFYPEKNVLITLVLKRRKRVEKEAILDDETSRILQRYIIKEKLKLDDYIFRALSYRQIQKRTNQYGKLAGLNHNFSFHNFRHFLITELVKQGWSYDKIAKVTGHSSVGTLAVYDHAVASDIKKDILNALKHI